MHIQDSNGNKIELFLEPSGDTLPIGSEVEFDGDVVPTGWKKAEEKGIIITNGEPVRTGRKIDGKWEYVKRISATFNGDSAMTIPCGLSGSDYNPIDFKARLDSTSVLFDVNTPRPQNSTQISASTLFGYWQYANDYFVVTANGQDRTGSIVTIELYFTYNEEA